MIAAEIWSPCACQKVCSAAATMPSGSINGMTRAVFLDALGTLVELEPPWISLRDLVPAEIGDEQLVEALRAEMAYYREHAHEGRDEASLADLRERCAALVSERARASRSGSTSWSRRSASPPIPTPFRRWPRCATAGCAWSCVSNWDCSPAAGPGAMRARRAARRRRSPRRRPARASPTRRSSPRRWSSPAARRTRRSTSGTRPRRTSPGARAAGIRPLLIDRDGGGGDIASLEEIDQHL